MDNQDSVAKRLGLENTEKGYELNRKSLLESIGGPLGIAEAVLPATLFSLAYAFTRDALTAVMLAAGSSVIFIIVRLVQRKALTQALVGALAIALAAFLALRDGGQAADYFVPGFITNASYGGVMLVSVLIGRPIMGYIAQLLFGIKDWRQDKPTYRRLRLVTLIWVGFFAARLSVQLPLYFAGLVEALALSRAIMGAPAYAGLLALTWVLLRKIATR
jgi:intracellular septation protein A